MSILEGIRKMYQPTYMKQLKSLLKCVYRDKKRSVKRERKGRAKERNEKKYNKSRVDRSES